MPINKCEHGIYIPKGELRADYCQCCTPGGPTNTKPVVLPRFSHESLSNVDRVMANKNSGSECPECRATIYLRVDEKGSDSNRECAECGKRYKVRLTEHQRAILVESEAQSNG